MSCSRLDVRKQKRFPAERVAAGAGPARHAKSAVSLTHGFGPDKQSARVRKRPDNSSTRAGICRAAGGWAVDACSGSWRHSSGSSSIDGARSHAGPDGLRNRAIQRRATAEARTRPIASVIKPGRTSRRPPARSTARRSGRLAALSRSPKASGTRWITMRPTSEDHRIPASEVARRSKRARVHADPVRNHEEGPISAEGSISSPTIAHFPRHPVSSLVASVSWRGASDGLMSWRAFRRPLNGRSPWCWHASGA